MNNPKEKFPEGLLVAHKEDDTILLLQYKQKTIDNLNVGYLLLSFYPTLGQFKLAEDTDFFGLGAQLFKSENLKEAVETFFDRNVFASHIYCPHEKSVKIIDNKINWSEYVRPITLSEMRKQTRELVPSYINTITD